MPRFQLTPTGISTSRRTRAARSSALRARVALLKDLEASVLQRVYDERLRLSPAEFDSLVRVLRSQLDLSVARLLVEPAR